MGRKVLEGKGPLAHDAGAREALGGHYRDCPDELRPVPSLAL